MDVEDHVAQGLHGFGFGVGDVDFKFFREGVDDLEIGQGVNVPQEGKLLPRERIASANQRQVHFQNVAEDAPNTRHGVESDAVSPEAPFPHERVIVWLASGEERVQVSLFERAAGRRRDLFCDGHVRHGEWILESRSEEGKGRNGAVVCCNFVTISIAGVSCQ